VEDGEETGREVELRDCKRALKRGQASSV